MTDEQMEFEFKQAEAYFGEGNSNSGQIVLTKTGLTGRTYSNDQLVNGKVKVYTEKGNMLCDPSTLILKGFID